jgi:hypothetical protein
MNAPPPSDQDDFQQQLEILRSLLEENLKRGEQNPLLGSQVDFWLESARFWELNIEIWGKAGNAYEENQARKRMRKVLDTLQELINRMNDEMGDGKS